MFPISKLESFHGDVTTIGEAGDFITILNINDSSIYGYNREGQVLDLRDIFSRNTVPEDPEPFEESENDMENFDPALFCPDIIMELGDTPIIIDTDEVAIDRSTKDEQSILLVPTEEKSLAGLPSLTLEENALRNQTYGNDHPVQCSRIHCTACNDHLGSALSGSTNMMVHPLLKVLICKECFDFYTSGEFKKDQDGSETYCRWCGQGGLVICCSNCEFVFCTRCIRNNFGRKILAAIRHSDDWTCYKCDPSQLIRLKVQCAELMDYIRRETARISPLANAASFVNTDYSRCCLVTNTQANVPKKIKRKYSDDDQDYDPDAEQLSRRSSSSSIKSVSSVCDEANAATVRKPLAILPNQANTTTSAGIVAQGCQNRATSGVAKSKTKTKVTFVSHPKPIMHTANTPSIGSDVRGIPVDSTQIGILPNGQRVTIMAPRSSAPTSAGRRQTTAKRTKLQPDVNNEQQRKKMCYETAVRAASRINSDLSCTLIKLREDKINARKLDDLVVVHNKLQEALHTSINSLIHLRKTLAVADMNTIISAPKQSQQSPATCQIHFNSAIVSNFFRVTPSPALKNFNTAYANFEEANLIGLKEQKESEENANYNLTANATNSVGNAGSAFQGGTGTPLVIISDSEISLKE